MEKTAAILIAVHMVGDFFLQPDWLVQRKTKFPYILLHAAIHGALAYLALQAWRCWQIPVLVLAIHAIIDWLKQYSKSDTVVAFVMDQVGHVLGLLLLAWMLANRTHLSAFDGRGFTAIVFAGGFTATVFGSGFLIAKFAKRLVEENGLELDGLRNGGKLIGQLERALIFLFIFISQPAGIGFLVAAKSILRFEEAKKQKLAEYVLIGTLLSFSLAVALSSATKWALTLK